jgi:hypothetical protein
MRAGARAVLAYLDDFVASIRPQAQYLHGAIRGLCPPAGHKALLLVRKALNLQQAETAQVKHPQPPDGQGRWRLGLHSCTDLGTELTPHRHWQYITPCGDGLGTDPQRCHP